MWQYCNALQLEGSSMSYQSYWALTTGPCCTILEIQNFCHVIWIRGPDFLSGTDILAIGGYLPAFFVS